MNTYNESFGDDNQSLNIPKGTVSFIWDIPTELEKIGSGAILEKSAGKRVFIIDLTPKLDFVFIYSSPGTGTKVTTINAVKIRKSRSIFILFTWSPEGTTLNIRAEDLVKNELISAIGLESPIKYQVDENNKIIFYGGPGIEVKKLTIIENYKETLSPTAIETWENIKSAINILDTGKSELGFIYEVVVANLSLSIMVTGFESYLKKRFTEIEEEGINPNIDKLIDFTLTARERKEKKDQKTLLGLDAKEQNVSLLKFMVMKRKFNFQNFKTAKKVFELAYDLNLTSAGIIITNEQEIKNLLKFRHKVIHQSPEIRFFNSDGDPPGDPIFSGNKFKTKALETFDSFIALFHKESLKLKNI